MDTPERADPEGAPNAGDGLQLSLAASGVGVWRLHADGRLHWSDGLVTLAGLTAATTPRSRDALLTLIHAEDRDRVRRALDGAFDGERGFSCEYRVVRPDGQHTHLATTATPIAATPRDGAHLHGVAFDATPRRLLEARLVRSQRLEAIGLVAASLAHDFNNQLVAILGYAEFLQRSANSPDQRRDLEHILDAGRQAASLAAQLLALSRQDGHEPRVLEVNAVVTALRSMLRRLAGEDIHLETALGDDLPTVRIDQGQLQQAIVNLAIEAGANPEAGGTIAISTSVTADGDDAGGGRTVRIVVRRDGAVERHGPDGSGTSPVLPPEPGLALDTARLIAERSGGALLTDAGAGNSRIYELRFPAARAIEPEAPERPAAALAAATGRETILVVDDEPAVRNLLESVLTRSGYTVLQAADAQQAQAVAGVQPIALLCTDVVMPGGSGVDLYRELSAVYPSLRVLYTSGYPERLLADRAALTPANFIRKPFMPADIVRRIRQILDH